MSVRTAKRFDVRAFPTLKFLSQGKVYDYSGARTLEAFQQYIEHREWLLPSSVARARPMPAEVSSLAVLVDSLRDTSNDLLMLLWRKPGGVAILACIGLLVGILTSMLVFIVWIEKKQQIYQVTLPAAAASALKGNEKALGELANSVARNGSFSPLPAGASASSSPMAMATPTAAAAGAEPTKEAATKKKE